MENFTNLYKKFLHEGVEYFVQATDCVIYFRNEEATDRPYSKLTNYSKVIDLSMELTRLYGKPADLCEKVGDGFQPLTNKEEIVARLVGGLNDRFTQ